MNEVKLYNTIQYNAACRVNEVKLHNTIQYNAWRDFGTSEVKEYLVLTTCTLYLAWHDIIVCMVWARRCEWFLVDCERTRSNVTTNHDARAPGGEMWH